MQITYQFNADALRHAATLAGDTKSSGSLNYERIGKRSGIDRAVVSRVHRRLTVPDLKTVLGMARAYGLNVEDLVTIAVEPIAMAA